MKSRITAFIFLMAFNFFTQSVVSQNIPAFTTSVFDSSLTGYFFFTSMNLSDPQPGVPPAQFIVDSGGDLVYYNTFPSNPLTIDFKIQPDGRMSYFRDSQFYIMDSSFTIIDSVSCIGYDTDPHDLQILSNGYYLLLGAEYITMDLSSYHYFNHNGSAGSDTARVQCGIIQMLDINKNVVFEWHASTHFQFDDVYQYWLFDPYDVDWTHCNSIEMDTDGNLLLSTRHFNEITKVNSSTGNIIWRMGGKRNQFTFYNDSLNFYGQHDVRRIANGNITLFDNGKFVNTHAARGVEYVTDEINMTATMAWSYIYDPAVSSFATGNTQRVSNKRTLIDFGLRTNSTVCFTLVDSLNNKLFELSFQDSLASYRAFYYPALPWNLNRPELTCLQQGSNYFLQTVSAYNSYQWSNGATTASIQITAPENYFVFIPYGEGFIKSKNFVVTNMSNPCSVTSIGKPTDENYDIFFFPNPSAGNILCTYHFPKKSSPEARLYDQFGRLMSAFGLDVDLHEMYIYADDLTDGVYYFQVNLANGISYRNKLLIIH